MKLTVRPATSDDLSAVAGLYQEATQWLASQGYDQWQPTPDGRQTLEKVRQAIARSIQRGECYLAFQNAQPIATITIDSYADPEFWTEDDDPTNAIYIHRMIVGQRHKGLGIGRTLVDFAATLAVQTGRKWLRLDAWRTNAELHDYYRRLGFQHVRTVEQPHRGSGALFQQRADERLNDPGGTT